MFMDWNVQKGMLLVYAWQIVNWILLMMMMRLSSGIN